MSTAAPSIENAFRDACEGGAVLGADADPLQLDLLRDPETGKLPANVFRLVRGGDARRGTGRPAGARNKRSEKLAKLIVQNHGDPVMFMASVYSQPLDQLVELLRIADNAHEREQRLVQMVERVEGDIARIAVSGSASKDVLKGLERLVDRLADVAKVLRSTPGKLAVEALALQVQTARATAEYVHGKQPVSLEITRKADMVLLIPGLNAPADMDMAALGDAIGQRGLDAVDFENMRLLPATEVDGDDEPDSLPGAPTADHGGGREAHPLDPAPIEPHVEQSRPGAQATRSKTEKGGNAATPSGGGV